MRISPPLTFKLGQVSAIALLESVILPSISRSTPPDVVVFSVTLFGLSNDRDLVLRALRGQYEPAHVAACRDLARGNRPQLGEDTLWLAHAAGAMRIGMQLLNQMSGRS